MPDLQLLPLGQTIVPFRADPQGISVDVYDVVSQRFSSQHFHFDRSGVTAHPVEFRYAWPAELDLMARIAGLTLRGPLGGLERRAVHQPQPLTRLGLREALSGYCAGPVPSLTFVA